MQDSNPNWRNRYYATLLDNALAVARESEKRPKSTVFPTKNDDLVLGEQTQPSNNLPTTLSYTPESNSTNTSPRTLNSNSSPDDSRLSTLGNSITSPSTLRGGESHNSPSSSQPPSTEVLSCPECPSSPNNKFQNRSNLNRHMHSTKKHNNGMQRHTCPMADCNAPLGRSDNVNKHLKNVHGIENLSRHDVRKRRREDNN